MEKIKRALEAMGIPIAIVQSLLDQMNTGQLDWLGGQIEQVPTLGLTPQGQLITVARLFSQALGDEKIVFENCTVCDHSGVYRDSDMPEDVGTKCRECDGRGWQAHVYSPFAGLALRDDVAIVCPAKKLQEGPICPEDGVPYQDFLAGVMPGEGGKAR